MTLHELPADVLLAKLADAQEAYVAAKRAADEASKSVDAVFAQQYLVFKSNERMSVEDARQHVKSDSNYIESWRNALDKAQERDKAMMALERVRTACDLWRTEQASRRKV